MHGRLKVRTTEEQQKIKKCEQDRKLAAYRHGMKVVLFNRKNEEVHQPSIEISAKLLIANPDIYTLWNYRKEIALKLLKNYNRTKTELELKSIDKNVKDLNISNHEIQEAEKNDDLEQSETPNLNTEKCDIDKCDQYNSLISYLNGELDLTKTSLLANPKSYNAWHHRHWILLHHPKPNWQNEFDLVNEYLKHDNRNFHVWDYRRLILKKVNISPEEDLEFTRGHIHVNFSNYSSWHYRSTILKLTPENVSLEIEMVENAIFTDPEDSSAWYYLNWILNHDCVSDGLRQRLSKNLCDLHKLEPENRRVIIGLSILHERNYKLEDEDPLFLKRVQLLQNDYLTADKE